MNLKIIIIALFNLIVVQNFFAQKNIVKLSLDSCIQIAIVNNLQLKMDEQNVRISEKILEIEKGNRLPSVNVEGQYMLTDQYEDMNSYNYGFAGVQIYQPIWQYGKLKVAVEESLLNSEASQIQFEVNKSDIILYTNIAYINTLKSEEIEKLSNEIVGKFAVTVDAAKERLKLGVAKRSDVLKAETEYSNIEFLSIQASTLTSVSKQNLLQLIALSPNTLFNTHYFLDETNLLLETLKLDSLVEIAYENLPELQLLKKQIQRQSKSILLAEKNQYPEIGAFANYNWTDNPIAIKELYGSVGLSLRFNVFNGFKKKNAIAIEKIKYEQINFREQELILTLVNEIKIAQLELFQAKEKIKNAEQQLTSSKEALLVVNEEYLQGLSSMLELIDAQYANFTANRNLVNAKADYHLSVAKLKRRIGL